MTEAEFAVRSIIAKLAEKRDMERGECEVQGIPFDNYGLRVTFDTEEEKRLTRVEFGKHLSADGAIPTGWAVAVLDEPRCMNIVVVDEAARRRHRAAGLKGPGDR